MQYIFYSVPKTCAPLRILYKKVRGSFGQLRYAIAMLRYAAKVTQMRYGIKRYPADFLIR